ncbi:hypothetical protein SAMN05444362_106164 [Dysgonomonas macrotermitis]|uniref:Uncharacterized protein n=1 Tax=Dysgonomonas macrotermitis TaxID=1346286 RepID=A0A1M5BRT0_9BACT|nr:hypothetical protein SAMN05444362_106164 [Dysgonomonas macrotermitis]
MFFNCKIRVVFIYYINRDLWYIETKNKKPKKKNKKIFKNGVTFVTFVTLQRIIN